MKPDTTLYCFSPPVMLATLLIEVIGALYIVWRYKMTTTTRLIVAILLSLAVFQGAEFMICGGAGMSGGTWSKLGYSAITLLPPLGLHLSYVIAGKKNPWLISLAYASAVAFVAYFAFYSGSISGQTCYANYVVFDTNHNPVPHFAYMAYYYGWLLIGTWTAFRLSLTMRNKHLKTALAALGVGYAAFIIPTTAVNVIDPSTTAAIPSIMCGFAVILALILVGKVAPEAIQAKDSRSLWVKFPM